VIELGSQLFIERSFSTAKVGVGVPPSFGYASATPPVSSPGSRTPIAVQRHGELLNEQGRVLTTETGAPN
jgi:hypothetical protein